jgi:hypothetical protein
MEDTSRVLGVSLVSEFRVVSGPLQKHTHETWPGEHVLGVVLVDPNTLTIRELRKMLSEQLEALPSSFRFVTRQGLVPSCLHVRLLNPESVEIHKSNYILSRAQFN